VNSSFSSQGLNNKSQNRRNLVSTGIDGFGLTLYYNEQPKTSKRSLGFFPRLLFTLDGTIFSQFGGRFSIINLFLFSLSLSYYFLLSIYTRGGYFI
jgi:hypothetical protein